MNMLLLRQWHGYISALIAPSVVFFALTGAIQLFSLHEAHGAYQPSPLVEKLARVHKDQVFALSHRHKATPVAMAKAPPASPNEAPPARKDALSTLLLKWFFLVVAMGLSLTTAFGVWLGLTRVRGAAVFAGLLIAGAVIPLILLVLRL